MRILVHEFVSGGGLAGQPVAPSLAREGGAMLAALVADLAAMRQHEIVTTTDSRFWLRVPSGVEVLTLESATCDAQLDELIAAVDAVWLIAPESAGTLEQLTARVERAGKIVLGSPARAVRRAADKAQLSERLARHRIPHPATAVLFPDDDCELAACGIGYPLIVKPATGAGCSGVYRVCDARRLQQAVDISRRLCSGQPLLLQKYVRGVPASVSLLADGRRAVALVVNGQKIAGRFQLSYRGGVTPLEHPRATDAADAAVRVCRALRGLRGYIGVDVVLAESSAVVIEVNPRLTTAYLGTRAAVDQSIAALAIDACLGSLPAAPAVRRRIEFDAGGRLSNVRASTPNEQDAEKRILHGEG
jgi:predicted ATP-grasp superfamily ATP-dependent carboligase